MAEPTQMCDECQYLAERFGLVLMFPACWEATVAELVGQPVALIQGAAMQGGA